MECRGDDNGSDGDGESGVSVYGMERCVDIDGESCAGTGDGRTEGIDGEHLGSWSDMIIGARILPATYTPSKGVNVSIGIVPGQTAPSYTVEDQPPLGWTVSDINEGGVWDDSDKKVKWGPFSDTAMRLLTYKATPPAGESGIKTFTGVVLYGGTEVAISGNSQTQ